MHIDKQQKIQFSDSEDLKSAIKITFKNVNEKGSSCTIKGKIT